MRSAQRTNVGSSHTYRGCSNMAWGPNLSHGGDLPLQPREYSPSGLGPINSSPVFSCFFFLSVVAVVIVCLVFFLVCFFVLFQLFFISFCGQTGVWYMIRWLSFAYQDTTMFRFR